MNVTLSDQTAITPNTAEVPTDRPALEKYPTAMPREAKIMVVDDELTNIKVVRRLLELEGYSEFVTTTDSTTAVSLIWSERPDLVLLDLMMPSVSGMEILSQVRSSDKLPFIPIVVLTAATGRETKLQALELGATDFLGKPLDPSELVARVRNVLAIKAYQDRLQNYSKDLEMAVRHRTIELESSRADVIHCLARAAEYRDDDTGQHVIRVGRYARLIAEALGWPEAKADQLEQAAQLHDVGKIGVPDKILLKPGKLSTVEFSHMQQHCSFGKHILQPANSDEAQSVRQHAEVGAKILSVGASPVLMMAEKIALTHHEWWDGTGYPFKLAGEDIPLVGRITAIADVFDALSSKRCYKEAVPLAECFEILQSERGTHFDPKLLDLFISRRDEITQIQLACVDQR